jgi:hypothetical protein
MTCPLAFPIYCPLIFLRKYPVQRKVSFYRKINRTMISRQIEDLMRPVMKIPSFLAATALFFALSLESHGATLSLVEMLNSYAWGSSRTVSGVISLNLWNDSTGAVLTSDNGDAPDVTMTLTTLTGALGTGGFDYNATSDTLRASHAFTGSVASNNPGTRVVNRVTFTFASHLTVTALELDFSSLNTAGVTWETSQISVINPVGNFFSSTPTLAPYLSHTSTNGSPSAGHYMVNSKATVLNVGANITNAGASSAVENLTGTNGNGILDYTDLALASGTQLGGFTWTTTLEDVRGISTAASGLTSSLTSFKVSGTINVPVPEPSIVSLLALSPFIGRRRRQ